MGLWAWLAKRPEVYRTATGLAVRALKLLGRKTGSFAALPLAGGWTAGRDLPVPQAGGTFMAQYAKSKRQ
jgi:L-lactate dehydrogenase complex protein LldF